MARLGCDGPRVRVGALILLDGNVVVVRHRAGDATYHLLPGGGVHYRETLGDALVREVHEETGLDVTVGRPLVLNDTIDPNGPRHLVNVTFAAEVVGGALLSESVDKRIEAIELVAPDMLRTLDLRPPITTAILEMLATSATTPARYLGPLFTPETPCSTAGDHCHMASEGGGPTTEGY